MWVRHCVGEASEPPSIGKRQLPVLDQRLEHYYNLKRCLVRLIKDQHAAMLCSTEEWRVLI